MKQFLKVLRFELNNYTKNKGFVMTTVLLALLAVIGIAAPTIYQNITGKGEGKQEEVQEAGTEGKMALAEPGALAGTARAVAERMPQYQWEFIEAEKEEALEQVKDLVEKGEAEGGFVLDPDGNYTYVVENLSMQDSAREEFQAALQSVGVNRFLGEKGVDLKEYAAVAAWVPVGEDVILGKDGINNFLYTYVMVFVLYFLILFYGQMIATSITTEKSNRAIEILVTSVDSTSLIFGKVLAGAIAGLVQTAVILGGAVLSYRFLGSGWNGQLDMLFNIPGEVWASFLVFGLLGYLLYAFAFGMLGALVSKTEDISKSATPLMLVFIAAFLITMWSLSNVDSVLMQVASYVPFTSCMAMLARIAMGGVGIGGILLSGGILAASCLLMGWLAAKVFRFGTLMYGNPIKLTRALRQMKNQD